MLVSLLLLHLNSCYEKTWFLSAVIRTKLGSQLLRLYYGTPDRETELESALSNLELIGSIEGLLWVISM